MSKATQSKTSKLAVKTDETDSNDFEIEETTAVAPKAPKKPRAKKETTGEPKVVKAAKVAKVVDENTKPKTKVVRAPKELSAEDLEKVEQFRRDEIERLQKEVARFTSMTTAELLPLSKKQTKKSAPAATTTKVEKFVPSELSADTDIVVELPHSKVSLVFDNETKTLCTLDGNMKKLLDRAALTDLSKTDAEFKREICLINKAINKKLSAATVATMTKFMVDDVQVDFSKESA